MFIRNELKEFMEQMETILVEKFPKYGDGWKTTFIGIHREKMKKQMNDITNIIISGVDWDKEKVRRKLIHIANYCMFLENIIKND